MVRSPPPAVWHVDGRRIQTRQCSVECWLEKRVRCEACEGPASKRDRCRWCFGTCTVRSFPSYFPVHKVAHARLSMSSNPSYNELGDTMSSYERNAATGLCSLPSEVLVAIFELLQHGRKPSLDTDADTITPFSRLNHDGSWTRMMLVCVHLRKIALATPGLWAVQDRRQDSPSWHLLTCRRAGDVPLILSLQDVEYPSVMQDWKRARVARVANCPSHAYGPLLDSATPALEALHLHTRLRTRWPFILSRGFLGGSPDMLVHLVLDGPSVLLRDAPSLPMLRYLFLSKVVADVGFEALCRCLKRMPVLEELVVKSVDFCHLVDADHVLPVPERISLPHLRTLFIAAFLAESAALLRCLPLPATSLSVTTLYSQNNRAGPDLNANHIFILDAYRVFVAQEPPVEVELVLSGDGDNIRIGSDLTPDALCRCTARTACCTLDFTCTGPLPQWLADSITAIRLEGYKSTPPPGGDLDENAGVRSLTAVRKVTFSLYLEAGAPLVAATLPWMISRLPQLRVVQFVHCDRSLRPFSDKLRQDGLFPEVEWEDGPTYTVG
jgi:hypothetical protein